MGCSSCGNDTPMVKMPCKVCEIVHGDETIKLVTWCDDCKAYICGTCKKNIPARGLAMLFTWFSKK